jgi:hypothetical protein
MLVVQCTRTTNRPCTSSIMGSEQIYILGATDRHRHPVSCRKLKWHASGALATVASDSAIEWRAACARAVIKGPTREAGIASESANDTTRIVKACLALREQHAIVSELVRGTRRARPGPRDESAAQRRAVVTAAVPVGIRCVSTVNALRVVLSKSAPLRIKSSERDVLWRGLYRK